MELEEHLLRRVRNWDEMSRWERSELGRDLRTLGMSYGEIMDLIPVKKSTLATWCRDVSLTAGQLQEIRFRRTPEPGMNLRGKPYTTQRPRRREIEIIKAKSLLEAESLVYQPFCVAGVSMYWGEGSKATRRLSMANADPAALRMFKNWSDKYLPPNDGWRARLNLHADNDEIAAREWWSGQGDVELDDFTKTYIKPDGTGHRKNHLPNGVCTLTKRRSTDAYLITMSWIEFLQNHYGS
ncbi:hypothetical protein BH23ACT4_BH23ACT4_03710 [soil metagenome]